ncbi:DUF4179 domain-containing protein [Paenibacillus sp. JX-17]|uniref:DUF4179 domain-containing protein n=1 Tax=Paenibacillus lacisoli TaxID=3064525 RepID=A0ABT9CES8_9BACL|nr:DUF4179 domain-containing protein [Paenibacillus sp. JX-17]MDO7907773.1 DUF4179 domain-containing protein [Paenibacillus sp. JX-17]
MRNADEQRLMADARQMKQEQDSLNELDAAGAVWRGMQQGKRRKRLRTAGLQFGAVVVTAAIVFMVWVGVQHFNSSPSIQAAVQQADDWGQLAPFRQVMSRAVDQHTLESAIRHGYIQMVNQTVKEGAYQITLNAVTADENRLIILYTGETDTTQDIYDIPSVKVNQRQNSKTLGWLGGTQSVKSSLGESKKMYGITSIPLDRSQPFPEQLKAEFRVSSVDSGISTDPALWKNRKYQFSKSMIVNFDLSLKFTQYKTVILKPAQSFLLNGYPAKLAEVELSPLVMNVKFEFDARVNRDWKIKEDTISKLTPAKLVAKTQEHVTELSSVSGIDTEKGYSYQFGSNFLDSPDSLVLQLYPEVRKPGAADAGLKNLTIK